MTEALFQAAWSSMIEKAMSDQDFNTMMEIFNQRFPQAQMRDDVGVITEFAGMGGFDEGFRMAGIPTFASVEAWDAANDVRRDNQEGEVIQGYIGTEQGMLHPDDLIERYARASQGRPVHYHASPPCQAFTMAQRKTGPAGKTPEEIHEDRLAAFPMIGNALYTAEQMMRHPDINLNSWSLEEAPAVAQFIKENPHLLDKYVSKPFQHRVMQLLTNQPKLDAINFGVPTTRGRTFIGEGWNAEPTHYHRDRKPVGGAKPSPTVLDFLPHLQREEEENRPNKQAIIDQMLADGKISPPVADILMGQGWISQSGGVNPGTGRGAPWLNPNATSKKTGLPTTFQHRKPLDSNTTGITHNMPSLAYKRRLTPQEVMMIQGFRPDYDISSAAGRYYRKTNPRTGKVKSIPAADQMIGNVVSPAVSRAIARGAFGSNRQKTLMDDFS
jgi:site-specific DNA-cytosine methylase